MFSSDTAQKNEHVKLKAYKPHGFQKISPPLAEQICQDKTINLRSKLTWRGCNPFNRRVLFRLTHILFDKERPYHCFLTKKKEVRRCNKLVKWGQKSLIDLLNNGTTMHRRSIKPRSNHQTKLGACRISQQTREGNKPMKDLTMVEGETRRKQNNQSNNRIFNTWWYGSDNINLNEKMI